MANIDTSRTDTETAPGPSVPSWLRGRRGLLILAAAVITAGLALNWSWLTVVGAAPIILALAPCAVMCGLGLCMKGGSGKSCSPGNSATADTSAGEIRGN